MDVKAKKYNGGTATGHREPTLVTSGGSSLHNRAGYEMVSISILQSKIGLADIGIRQQRLPTAGKNDAAGFEHIAVAR